MHGKGTARAVGLLFIGATVAGVLSVVLLEGRPAVSALMVVFMAAAIAMIPPVLFPVLKRHNETLALGYVVSRTLEVAVLLPFAVNPLLMNDDENVIQPVGSIFFCLSAVLLNYVLFRSRLVPRAISVWALVGVVPY